MTYILYDWINDIVKEKFLNTDEVIKSANEFYHDTFQGYEDYDENKKILTIEEAIELYEGSGYAVYVEFIKLLNFIRGF